MNKIISGVLVALLATSVYAATERDTFIQNAKDTMSFEDGLVAETAKSAANQKNADREHFVSVAKDMMSFEDGFVAETARSAEAQTKHKGKSKKQKSAPVTAETLHIDP